MHVSMCQCISINLVEVPQQLEKKQSRKGPPRVAKNKETKTEDIPLPKSDAVLNCPACMITLSLDCQRYVALPPPPYLRNIFIVV